MRVFQLSYPGCRLKLESQTNASELEILLSSVEICFHQAVVEVGLFDEACRMRPAIPPVGVGEMSVAGERKQQENSSLPFIYAQRIPFIYARSFLYTVHNIRKHLNTIATLDYIPQDTKVLIARMDEHFPFLRGVRDSSAHVEERVKGRTRGKPIIIKPVESQAFRAPAGSMLVIESLMNNRFVSTTAEGDLGKNNVQGCQNRGPQAGAAAELWPVHGSCLFAPARWLLTQSF